MYSNQSLKILFYALPAAPMAALYFPVFVYLAEFYSSNFGISIALIGFTFLIVRLFDGLLDPLFGFLSDKINFLNIRRRLWLIISTPILVVSIWYLYMPEILPFHNIKYFIIWLVLATIGWSAFITPYYALGTELTDDYHERSTVAIIREALALVGTIIAAGLYALAENSVEAFENIAYFIIFGLPLSTILCVIYAKEDEKKAGNIISASSVFNFLRNLIHNRSYSKLILAYFINGAANGLPATLFIYFVNTKLELQEYSGVLLLVYFISAVAASPVWIFLSKRFSKPKLWSFSMIYASIIFLFVIFLGSGDFFPFLVICFLAGAAVGADLGIPASIQADIIEIDTLKSGENRAGLYFAIWSIVTKAAIAFSSGFGLILLSKANFLPGGDNSSDTILLLTILYCVLPVVLKMISVRLIWSLAPDNEFSKL